MEGYNAPSTIHRKGNPRYKAALNWFYLPNHGQQTALNRFLWVLLLALADFGDCGKVIQMSRYRVQSEIETSICVYENASNLRALSILKARTHTPIFGGSALEPALELANSSSELADSNAYSPMGM